MASRFVNARGPVQIVRDNGDHTFSLCENNLSAILMSPLVKDSELVVVSVAGAFREGKSFLLDWFLRYLLNKGRENWMGEEEEELTGFDWRGGVEKNTSGIWMWGQPFFTTNPITGKKVAILLMDTQGTFDNQSIVRDSAIIFALSTMLSSIQVYNISKRIREDDLQYLQFFTAYGMLAMQSGDAEMSSKPFQRLEILIRDWENEYQYSLGRDGGKKYLEHVLEIKETQHEELQEVRKHIENCFEDVGCYLLPYPGQKVASKPEFKGFISDMDPDFVKGLKELVPQYLHSSCLKPKRIGGQVLKGKDFLHYFKSYMETYQQDELPKPKTMLRVTAEASNFLALEAAKEIFVDEMDRRLAGSNDYLNLRTIMEHIRGSCAAAVNAFNSCKKLGGTELSDQYLGKLMEYTKDKSEYYVRCNESRNEANRIPTWFLVAQTAMDFFGRINEFRLLSQHRNSLLDLDSYLPWLDSDSD